MIVFLGFVIRTGHNSYYSGESCILLWSSIRAKDVAIFP